MTYQTEHQKMKPILDKARDFDIATNPVPEALFDAGSAGFRRVRRRRYRRPLP